MRSCSTSWTGSSALALLGGEDLRVERHRPEEEIEHGRAEIDPAEAQVVEDVLELVREPRHPGRAKEACKSLERVDAAEDVVDELGVDPALLAEIVEHEQVAPEPVDQLLGFAEEIVSCAAVPPSPGSVAHGARCPPTGGSLARGDGDAGAASRPSQLSRSCSGVKGFGR